MTEQTYGLMNGHAIGRVMKEMVQRAMAAIERERFTFEATAKIGYDGRANDLVTSADRASQKIYVKAIREVFPTFGIIAEEDELHIPCTDPQLGDIYFTVDPLDGTKAFGRRQSHGVGTMIALVHNGKVIASCIGDAMTKEIYYYRPDGSQTHRLTSIGMSEPLSPKTDMPLSKQYALIRVRPEAHSIFLHRLLATPDAGGLCKDFQTADGSVGLSMARLWKGEVGLAIQPAVKTTPWDVTPVNGLNEKLGILQLQQGGDGYFSPIPYKTHKELFQMPETIFLHKRHLEEFLQWQHELKEAQKKRSR